MAADGEKQMAIDTLATAAKEGSRHGGSRRRTVEGVETRTFGKIRAYGAAAVKTASLSARYFAGLRQLVELPDS